jgi:hypothetical protein
MSAHHQTRTMLMPAHTRWSVCYKGQSIGLMSPDGACEASFRLPVGYSIMPYHGHVDGPGWLTLKVGPDTSIALAALGVSIGTIDFDRSVRVSSRFPRWVEIGRVSPVETSSSAGRARAGQSVAPPQSLCVARSEFGHRCDPRGPQRRKDDGQNIGAYPLDTRPRDRGRPGGCKSQPS